MYYQMSQDVHYCIIVRTKQRSNCNVHQQIIKLPGMPTYEACHNANFTFVHLVIGLLLYFFQWRENKFPSRDFPGSPVVKDSALLLQGSQVQFLVREQRSHMLYDAAK